MPSLNSIFLLHSLDSVTSILFIYIPSSLRECHTVLIKFSEKTSVLPELS